MWARSEESLGGVFDIIGNFIERLFDLILSFIGGLLGIAGDDNDDDE